MLQKIRDFVVGLWDALTRIGKNTKEIDEWFGKVLGRDERHIYNQELINTLETNLRGELSKEIPYSEIPKLIFDYVQTKAVLKAEGEKQLVIEGKPIGSMRTEEFIERLCGLEPSLKEFFDEFTEDEQVRVLERMIKIIGTWAWDRPYLAQVYTPLEFGVRKVFDEEIIKIIKPVVEEGKISMAEGAIEPKLLYASDMNKEQLERKERIEKIKGIKPKQYTPKQALTKAAAKEVIGKFTPVSKEFVTDFIEINDSRRKPRNVNKEVNFVRNVSLSVEFPRGIAGWLRGFFSITKENLINDLRDIFDNSIYAYSSNYINIEERPDGSYHKNKNNVEAYHNFMNKVEFGEDTYYVRFVVEELKGNKGQLHKAMVSNVSFYNEVGEGRLPSSQKSGETGLHSFIDENIIEFFDSVKSNSQDSSEESKGNDGTDIKLYAPDLQYSLHLDIEETDFWNQPSLQRLSHIIENNLQHYMFDNAYSAIEAHYGSPKDAMKDFKLRTDGSISDYSESVYYDLFQAIYNYFPYLQKQRYSVGNLTENIENVKQTNIFKEFRREVNSGAFFNTLRKLWIEQQIRTDEPNTNEEKQKLRALNTIVKKSKNIETAVNSTLNTGIYGNLNWNDLDSELRKKIQVQVLSREKLEYFKDLYGLATGNYRWIERPKTIDDIEKRLRSRKIFDDRLGDLHERLLDITSGEEGLPSIKKLQHLDAKVERDLEKAGKKLSKITERIREFDDYLNIERKVIEQYKERTKDARLTADRTAYNKLIDELVDYAKDTSEYQELIKKITNDSSKVNLKEIVSTIVNIQRLRGQEQAVNDLKRITDKAFYTILKKPPKDIFVKDKRLLEDVRTLLGNKTLRNYINGLYAERFHIEVMIEDYMQNLDFRAAIDKVLDPAQQNTFKRILEIEYDSNRKPVKWKKWSELTGDDKNVLKNIFAVEAVQKERINSLIREIQTNKAALDSVYSLMNEKEQGKIKKLLFNEDGSAKDLAKMDERVKTRLVRRITGRTEGLESLNIKEADAKTIAEAEQRIQESDKFSNDAKEILRLQDDGTLVFNHKSLDDVSKIANEVSEIIKRSRKSLEDYREAEQEHWSEVAKNLSKKVPWNIAGKSYSSLEGFKGEKVDGREYKKGDIVSALGKLYRAKEDTVDIVSNEGAWEELWSPDKPSSRGVFHKAADWWNRRLDPTRMAQLFFQEGGLKWDEGFAYENIIRLRNQVRNDYDKNRTRRATALIKFIRDKGIKDKEWTLHSFKAGDFDEKFNLIEVMYFWGAAQNEYARNAVLGGVFLSAVERQEYNTTKDKTIKKKIEAKANARYKAIIDEYDVFRKKDGNEKYHKVLEYIVQELQENYPRIKEFMEKEYNLSLGEENFYIPIRRVFLGLNEQSYEEQMQDIANPLGRYGVKPDKGFSINRKKISLGNQPEINYNLFDVYLNNINQVEKLMAYSPWIRKMQFIFESNKTEPRFLQQKLRSAFGVQGTNFWRTILRDEINNEAYKADKWLDNIFWFMRGSWVKGAVLGRASTLITQGITSMPASLTEISPIETLKGFQIYNSIILKDMLELSAYMYGRWTLEDLAKAGENMIAVNDYKDGKAKGLKPFNRAIDRFSASLLSKIDRLSVAPIFHAVYMREMLEAVKVSNGEITMDSKSPYRVSGKNAEAARAKAIEKAEMTVRMTQPDTDLFNKPIFLRQKSGAWALINTFKAPFVTLFNHWTWDIPQRLKRDFRGNIGLVIWGGLTLAASMMLMGFLRDEDKEKLLEEEPSEVMRRLSAYLLGRQGIFGNTPLVGMMLGALVESIITDKNPIYIGSQQYPQYGRITRVISDIKKDEDIFKTAVDMVSVLLWMNGTFAGQFDDIHEAVENAMKEDESIFLHLFSRGLLGVR